MYLLYSDFFHILFENPNFDNHPPSSYKILDKFPIINEGQLNEPKIKAIYLSLYILKTNF